MRWLRSILHRRWLFSLKGISIIIIFLLCCWLACQQSHLLRWTSAPHPSSSASTGYKDLATPSTGYRDTGDVLGDSKQEIVGHSQAEFKRASTVLIFSEVVDVTRQSRLVSTLEAYRIEYDLVAWSLLSEKQQSLPPLVDYESRAIKYSAFIFENMHGYLGMDGWNSHLLVTFCRSYKVGIVLFTEGSGLTSNEFVALPDVQLKVRYGVPGLSLLRTPKEGCGVLRTLKSALTIDLEYQHNRTVYLPLRNSYRPIANYYSASTEQDFAAALYDNGSVDGVERVFMGFHPKDHWSFDLIFIDSLTKLSNGTLGFSLERNILVDIDDVFVPKGKKRPTVDDVEELVRSQDRLAKKIPGFHYNLGLNGYMYNPSEYKSDDVLLRYASKFWWFCHMYHHLKPHELTYAELKEEITMNMKFAQIHNLTLDKTYSVAPHHSGVYPVHNPLYEAWKHTLGVKVTSTEEYPHLYPARKRRGFIYKDIQVLPRQVCGIYTTTLTFSTIKGRRIALDASLAGGTVFQTIMRNPISIFMTHYGNYGQDRLGSYVFETVVKFIQAWTNIQLVTLPPSKLGGKYFQQFPSDKEPLWQNPCATPRHLAIWPENKTCASLPHFVVVGPQKTGTTALHSFLSMHPYLQMNLPSQHSYEEVQFFSSNNYFKGLDWYMSYFPVNLSDVGEKTFFEKSATYFDSADTPRRMHALLPQSKIIVIIIDPVKRAYSWYQHRRSKINSDARRISFYDLMQGTPSTLSDEFLGLQSRCLEPGLYAKHLDVWLKYYKPEQIQIVDGDKLRKAPLDVLRQVQEFVGVKKQLFDYKAQLRFDQKKGFFCRIVNGKNECLGEGKGRSYPPMDPHSKLVLTQHYRTANIQLAAMLTRRREPLPLWLSSQMKALSSERVSPWFDRGP